MSNKLARAQHIRPVDPGSTSEIFVGGLHAGPDRTVIATAAAQTAVPEPQQNLTTAKARLKSAAPGETSEIFIGGRHAGLDRTAYPRDPFEPQTSAPHDAPCINTACTDRFATGTAINTHAGTHTYSVSETCRKPDRDNARITGAHIKSTNSAQASLPRHSTTGENDTATSVSSSAALISVCVLISRVLGFVRTWVMAFALGSTLLASSYQVANNLPAQLYELVIGGMIVTAFLPVYLSVKKRLGNRAGNEYASNLLTIVVVLLGIVSALCIAFPGIAIYTQSFYSDQSEMVLSVFFFQFFAIQIVFSGATAIISGLLNANRDYLWSSIAPAAQSVVVIVSFLLYAATAPQNPEAALYIIAIGNPLGVFIALAIQLPALRRNGVRLRPRINLRDPALRETLGIGIPAVFVMLCSFIVVSVQNAAAYSFAGNGPSILLYARQWFTLPYAFLAVPITTAMFTELADMQAEGNIEGVKRGIVSGTNQILFFMIPFALYLMVFSLPLVTLYHAGAFTMENVSSIASYLAILAFALPVYGVNTYLQKTFSSLRKMGVFAAFNFVAGAVQVALTMFGAVHTQYFPLEIIAFAEVMFYVVADVCLFAYLHHVLGAFGLRSVAKACISGVIFGALGAAAGGGVLFVLNTFIAPLSGSILQALFYVLAGGVVALAVTFGLAMAAHVPESAFISSLIDRVKNKFSR